MRDDASSPVVRPPLVAWAGLLLGSFMLVLSTVGLVWRIDPLIAAGALAAALAVAVPLLPRFSRRRGGPWPWLVLQGALLLVPTLAAFLPPHEWDEVAYGATLPRDYARAGRFFYNADYGPYSAMPADFEATTTASLLWFGSVVPVRLLNVALAFGLAVTAMHLCVRLGGRRLAPVAAVLVLAAPAVAGVATIVKNDLANAFFQGLVLLALADYAVAPRREGLVLAGFFLGTAVGIKYSSLQFALCVGVVALGVAWLRARSRREGLLGAGTLVGVAALAALPWYARNALLFGNPFFPFFTEVLGGPDGFTVEHARLVREMFEGLALYSASTGTLVSFLRWMTAGFGWLPILLAVPGLGVAVVHRSSWAPVLLAASLLSFGLFTYLAGYWEPRYVLSLLVLTAAFAGACAAAIARRVQGSPDGSGRAAVVALLVAALVVAVAVRAQVGTHGPLLRSFYGNDEERFLESSSAHFTVARWVNEHTKPGDKVGMGLDVKPFYHLQRPYFNIHFLTEKGNLQGREGADEFLEAFRSLGLDWVAMSPWRPGPRYRRALTPRAHAFARRFERAVSSLHRDGKIELAARLGPVRVYRVRTRPGAPIARHPRRER